MQRLSDKIAIARLAKRPPWTQRYLAACLAGQLGRNVDQWHSRLRNIETRYTPTPKELEVISDALGTDPDWQQSPDESPIRWRPNLAQLPGTFGTQIPLPYKGYVPSYGWKEPIDEIVSTSYSGNGAEELHAYRVRLTRNLPRFQPGTLILVQPHEVFIEGLYNIALSPADELQLGKIRMDNGRTLMEFANPEFAPMDVTDWRCLGYAKHAEETKEEGLS